METMCPPALSPRCGLREIISKSPLCARQREEAQEDISKVADRDKVDKKQEVKG